MGEILATYREALGIYRRFPLALLGPGLVLFVVAGLPAALLEDIDAHTAFEVLAWGLAQVTGFVASFLYYGYCEEVAGQARRGSVSVRRALDETMPVLPALIAGATLAGIGIGIGLALLVLPGIWIALRWAVVSPVISFEHAGPLAGLRRSHRLVTGHVRFVLLTAVAAVALEQVLSGAGDAIAAVAHVHSTIGHAVIDGAADVVTAPFAGLVVVGAYVRISAPAPQPA